MDRSFVLCTTRHVLRTGLATALVIIVVASGPRRASAEGNLGGETMLSKIASTVDALKSPSKTSKPLVLEQVRAKYDADRQLSEVGIALKNKNYERAAQLFEAGTAVYRNAGLIGEDQEYGLHYAAGLLRFLGEKYDEAGAELSAAIAIAERTQGRDGLQATNARLFRTIADMQGDDDCVRGQATLDALLPVYRKLDKCDTAEYRVALQWLGICALKQDKYDATFTYQKELCDNLRASKAGSEGELFPESLASLGKLYIVRKSPPEARRCFDEAAELYEKLRGRDDTKTKAVRSLALKMAETSTKIDDVSRIQNEWNTLEAQIAALLKTNDYREAVPIMRRQIEIICKVKGDESDEMLKFLLRLAVILEAGGETKDAAKSYAEILKIAGNRSGAAPEITNLAECRLGEFELKRGRSAEGRAHLTRALEYYRTKPSESKIHCSIHLSLAIDALKRGEAAVGLDHADAAYGLIDGLDREIVNSVIVSRARAAYICGGDASLRVRLRGILAECRARARAEFGDQDEVLADVLVSVAGLEYVENDPTCIATAMQALAIYGSILPADDLKTLGGATITAKYCRAFGEIDQARKFLEETLPKLRNLEKPAPQHVAGALRLLAGIDAHQGRKYIAEARYREAIAIMEKADAADKQLARDRKDLETVLAGGTPSFKVADNPSNLELTMSAKREAK